MPAMAAGRGPPPAGARPPSPFAVPGRLPGPLLPGLVGAGIAVLSYDKRGVGQSEPECCPGDTGHFNLLTAGHRRRRRGSSTAPRKRCSKPLTAVSSVGL
jgi:hypothetical protein